ncbi:DNA polymerase I [bacterium BMS3Abin07]|nr:DNA polymerase I [bacterium BMS3Abin07]GBE32710.1 DNA polymerase I [bacterium BMS3Bbin05]
MTGQAHHDRLTMTGSHLPTWNEKESIVYTIDVMKIFLIDGNSYIYRAFYAIRDLSTSKGEPTNAVFGFTNMLLKIMRDMKPEGILIAMDSREPTKRHDAYEHYKAQRPETPETLIQQIPVIKRIINALRIPILEMPGYEADDILATAARKLSVDPENEIYIVAADKDMLQVVNDRIKVYDPAKDIIIDADYVKNRFGVYPGRIPELMALMGDSIDNIPGARGIGPKTAKEILTHVDSLSELLENPELAGRERWTKLIKESSDNIKLSYELATLIYDAPVEINTDMCRMREPEGDKLIELFKELEFTSLLQFVSGTKNMKVESEIIDDPHRLKQVVSAIRGPVAFDLETTDRNPVLAEIVGISLCNESGKGYYIPVSHTCITDIRQPALVEVLDILRPVLEDSSITKIGHNIKYDIICMKKYGISVKGKIYDTMVASHLLNPNKSNHNLEGAVLQYLGLKKAGYREVAGKISSFAELDIMTAAQYSVEDSAYSFQLKDILFERLGKENLMDIYQDIEMPLISVLVDIEMAGVKIDTEQLKKYSKDIKAELNGIRDRIYGIAGREFNINSPKQLGEILFHEIGLTPVKKTKNGYSTDISVLKELSKVHTLPQEILDYRSLSKIKNTYLDTLPQLINPSTGRVHTSFNQTVTATGRLSSSEPNLQNIPARGEWGRKIRQAFIADEGNKLISADYSQIELRILAHMSRDTGLLDAFKKEIDIHSLTASEVFNVPGGDITPDMRRVAKAVNFGIIYGITPYGLAETLKCSPEEARQYIDRYFSIHPGVREFIDKTIKATRERGYSLTMFGRKRPIPEINSRNGNQRSQAERMAVNTPIQGTAADIIKIAMISVKNLFTSGPCSAKIILQVHDELLVECKDEDVASSISILRAGMENAAELDVPLKVDISSGENWAEAH